MDIRSQLPDGAIPWTTTATSGDNAAQTLAVAAVTGKQHYVLGYLVAVKGAAVKSDTDMTAVVKDGATAKITDIIGRGAAIGERIGVSSAMPIMVGTPGTAANLVVAAVGTSGGYTEASMWGYTL